jgi:hypothetical protein
MYYLHFIILSLLWTVHLVYSTSIPPESYAHVLLCYVIYFFYHCHRESPIFLHIIKFMSCQIHSCFPLCPRIGEGCTYILTPTWEQGRAPWRHHTLIPSIAQVITLAHIHLFLTVQALVISSSICILTSHKNLVFTPGSLFTVQRNVQHQHLCLL